MNQIAALSDHLEALLAWFGGASVVVVIVAAVKRRLKRSLREEVDDIYDAVAYWAAAHFKRHSTARFALKRYCRLLLSDEHSRYMYIPSRVERKLSVDEAFVPLKLESVSANTGIVTYSQLLNLSNRLRVIGDPGSGKSTLVKRILREHCWGVLQSPSKCRFPAIYELKRARKPDAFVGDDWLYDAIKQSTCAYGMPGLDKCFDAYATTVGLLVLLDGLDEVSSSQYESVRAALDCLNTRLAKSSANNIVLITMRTQFYVQTKETFRESFGAAISVKPFSPGDMFVFLHNWLWWSNNRDVSRIFKNLTDTVSLRDMCSNPLMLAMYTAADLDSGSRTGTPESRSDFYRQAVDELVLRRRVDQLGPPLARSKLYEQRMQVLGNVALGHLLCRHEAANCIPFDRAIDVVREVIDPSLARTEAVSFLRELSKETGLITEERSEESLRFIHLTFCEYFAAHAAINGSTDGPSKLLAAYCSNVGDPDGAARLAEVLPFAMGLMPWHARAPMIAKISENTDWQLLARCFLETKSYEHAAWQGLVDRAASELADPRALGSISTKWLVDLHLFSVVVRDAAACKSHAPGILDVDLQRFYADLVDGRPIEFGRLLKAYAEHDAPAAFRLAELYHVDLAVAHPRIVVSCCDQAPFLELILDDLQTTSKGGERWSQLLAEAALSSYYVAYQLFIRWPIPKLRSLPSGNAGGWCAPRLLGRTSLYHQALSIALSGAEHSAETPRLNFLRSLRAPNRYARVVAVHEIPNLIAISLVAALVLSRCEGFYLWSMIAGFSAAFHLLWGIRLRAVRNVYMSILFGGVRYANEVIREIGPRFFRLPWAVAALTRLSQPPWLLALLTPRQLREFERRYLLTPWAGAARPSASEELSAAQCAE